VAEAKLSRQRPCERSVPPAPKLLCNHFGGTPLTPPRATCAMTFNLMFAIAK
jgi:hypothetical protein